MQRSMSMQTDLHHLKIFQEDQLVPDKGCPPRWAAEGRYVLLGDAS